MHESKTIAFLAAALFLAAGLAGCCRICHMQRTQPPLAGTCWQLVQLDGRDLYPAAGTFTIRFSPAGMLTGSGDRNPLSGVYTDNERGELKIDRLTAAQQTCPPAPDQAFTAMLQRVTRYRIDDRMLLLLEENDLRAVLEAR